MFRETSIKATSTGVQTDRVCIGLDTDSIDHQLIREFVGQENYNKFCELFPRAMFNPGRYSSVMFGKDGSDYEMYVESGPDIISYDLGKSEPCIYHSLDSTHFKFIYEYLQTVVEPEIFSEFVGIINVSDLDVVYCKKTRRHMFSYLFKFKSLVSLPAIKKQIVRAMNKICPGPIELDDKLKVIYIGLARTWDSKTEMSVYFRDV